MLDVVCDTAGVEKIVSEFVSWLMKMIGEYSKSFSAEDLIKLTNIIFEILECGSDIMKKIEPTLQVLNAIARQIEKSLGLTLVILTVGLVAQVYTIYFKIGNNFKRSFKLNPKWYPNIYDLTVATGSILSVWLPGMTTWGTLAGPVLFTTSVSTVALIPTLIAGTGITGWYLGSRMIKRLITSG